MLLIEEFDPSKAGFPGFHEPDPTDVLLTFSETFDLSKTEWILNLLKMIDADDIIEHNRKKWNW